jgi:hypothetical protein
MIMVRIHLVHGANDGMTTHLVTITPLKVLGADVLVGVLRALWQRRKMAPVLPVVIPQPVCIGASNS